MKLVRVGIVAMILAVSATATSFSAPSDTVTLATPLDSRNAATSESNFGDLLADSVLAAAPQASFALVTADETPPAVIPAGKTDSARIVSELRDGDNPNDTVVVMKLSGATVRDAILHGLSRAPAPYDGFLQIAGLRLSYDSTKTGTDRIASLTVAATGQALDMDASYSVAMPSYLASGALGYFSVWSRSDSSEQPSTTSIAAALTTLLSQRHNLSCQTDGRISGS